MACLRFGTGSLLPFSGGAQAAGRLNSIRLRGLPRCQKRRQAVRTPKPMLPTWNKETSPLPFYGLTGLAIHASIAILPPMVIPERGEYSIG